MLSTGRSGKCGGLLDLSHSAVPHIQSGLFTITCRMKSDSLGYKPEGKFRDTNKAAESLSPWITLQIPNFVSTNRNFRLFSLEHFPHPKNLAILIFLRPFLSNDFLCAESLSCFFFFLNRSPKMDVHRNDVEARFLVMSAIYSMGNVTEQLFWFSENEPYLQFFTLLKMSLWFLGRGGFYLVPENDGKFGQNHTRTGRRGFWKNTHLHCVYSRSFIRFNI